MIFTPCPLLPEVIIVEPNLFTDDRGYLMETYHQKKFTDGGIGIGFVQDNQSLSKGGTLRGLHYQIKRSQGKLVRVLHGEIFDVCVDIRRSSPNFGTWFGIVLSARNRKALYVPPNFAHGFCVVTGEAEVLYKCTDFYDPEYDRAIRWNDPDLAIEWPVNNPIISERDAGCPFLKEAELPA